MKSFLKSFLSFKWDWKRKTDVSLSSVDVPTEEIHEGDLYKCQGTYLSQHIHSMKCLNTEFFAVAIFKTDENGNPTIPIIRFKCGKCGRYIIPGKKNGKKLDQN